MIRISKLYFFHALLAMTSAITINVHADVNDSAVKVKWGYLGNTGPDRWAQLSPQFALCSAGKLQSPINIAKKVKIAPNKLTINYTAAPLDVMFDGTTSLLLKNTQTIINDGHTIQVNFPNTPETLVFNGDTYRLLQFHIHTPSENQLHGRSFPMEIHFVHQGQDGKAAALGVFVEGGEKNPALQTLIDHLPGDIGKEHVIQGARINPSDLLPSKHDYYSFAGSLTTPPCSEGLQWILMPTVITASPAQIVELRKAIGGANARDVQPLNRRPVYFNEAN